MTGLFFLASASDATPLLAALLVGILLLVGGLLLFLLPRVEQRKPSPRWRSRSPVPTLPGYRIRREQASTPRQFLAVSRIAALTPHPAEPPPAPPEMADGGGAVQTIPSLPAEERTIEEPTTLTLPLPEPAPPEPLREEITTREPEQAMPHPAPAADVTSGAEASLPANPASNAPLLEQVAESNQPDIAVENVAQTAVAAEDTTLAPLIRKARLADVLSERAIERPYSKEAPSAAQPSPEVEPPTPKSAARRAHLVGFPAPSAHAADAPSPNPSGTSEGSQESASSSLEDPSSEAETLSDTPVGAGVEGKAEEQTGAVNPSQSKAASQPTEAVVASAVRILCFGTVDLLLDGAPLSPLDSRFRASREFELLAFLAQSTAQRRQSFVDRSAITEALLAEGFDEDDAETAGDGEEYRRSPLGGWKYRLCRRLRSYGLPDHAWLETRADGALRLRPDVQVDLIDFLQVTGQLRKARDLLRRDAGQPIARETAFAWLQQLQHIYRDRGEFAEQFKFQEWTQEPRRRYRNIYWHALFYAAELLAGLGERQTAIQLAEELLDQEEVETAVVYEALLIWLHEEGNKSDLARWLNKYREWYAAAHDDRSLERDCPELISRLSGEPSPSVPVKKPSA